MKTKSLPTDKRAKLARRCQFSLSDSRQIYEQIIPLSSCASLGSYFRSFDPCSSVPLSIKWD